MTEVKPLVTVYITNHNYGRFIEKSIQSVLKQSLQDFELIIIDDGSTDDSIGIIETYKSLENVSIIYQKNKGLNITNNIALRVSKGKYIVRLDADDYFDENALLLLSNEMERNEEIGLVFPDYYLIDENDNVIGLERRHQFEEDVILFDQPAHGACTMIRKNYLQELGGYDESFTCQDGYDLWLKFINQHKVKNINTPLFYYRQHGSNLTKNEKRILSTRQKIKENHFQKLDLKCEKALAIIPVRGSKSSQFQIAFEKINGEYLIDQKIKYALDSVLVEKVIVTTPDHQLIEYLMKKYGDENRVLVHTRDVELSRQNVSLVSTIDEILKLDKIQEAVFKWVILLAPEFPFITPKEINDAIYTIKIFGAESLISVRQENSIFFQHDGSGMKPILNQEKFTKLERESLYRNTGGIIVTDLEYFKKARKLIGGKVGHIIVDQKAAHGIFSDFDLKLAKLLTGI